MIERKVNPLKDLSYTYYVVEDIKYEVKDKRRTPTGGANEIYEAMELADKENLKPLEEIIEKIFKKDYDLKYNRTTNHRCYMSITIKGRINQVDKLLIKSKIKEDQYHVEIIEKKEKTIINIHNEGLNLGLNPR